MNRRSVLISGGGIAGATLAYWLAEREFDTTVVERAAGLRSSGSPVDVRGEAVDVVERMGVLPELTALATSVTALTLVDTTGRPIASLDTRRLTSGSTRDIEVARSDLAATLARAAMSRAEFLFGDSIAALTETPGGVDVTFDSGRRRRFDLVVGADGQHSNVRRLVFGADADFVRFLGLYVATVVLDGPADDPHRVLLHNAPGRSVSVHPAAGTAIAAFIYRSAAIPGFDHRDTGQHRRALTAAYAGMGWRTLELLDRVQETDELYFDAVSQVRLSRWARGRVVLLGDAASSVSLFGEGSSLAITGAKTLAAALGDRPGEHAAAFAHYEAAHRRRVQPRQRGVSTVARVLVPSSRAGIAVRDTVARIWPRVGTTPTTPGVPASTGTAG